jgi:response regulator NasT
MNLASPAGSSRRVLIVDDDPTAGSELRKQVEKLGQVVVGQASAPEEAAKLHREQKPDIVLLDFDLEKEEGTNGIQLGGRLLAERRAPLLMISGFSSPECIERVAGAGFYAYLVKPVSVETIGAQMEVSLRRFQDHELALMEKEQLTQTLETRKYVERAKGIFMKRLNLDEAEAHKRLQQESQKRRIPLGELAKKIIESEDLLGGGG